MDFDKQNKIKSENEIVKISHSLEKFNHSDYEKNGSVGVGTFSEPLLVTTKTGDKAVIKSFDMEHKMLEKIGIFPAEYVFMHNLLDHDNIAKISGIFCDDYKYHMIMDYYPGGDLLNYGINFIKKLDPQDRRDVVSNLARQILDALEHCHLKNIVHRDIKPENIFLSEDKKKAYLADFGFATYQKPGCKLTKYLGTPYYSAPEFFYGDGYDGRKSDLWSFGITMYVLLTGVFPFSAPNIHKLLVKVANSEPRFDFPALTSDIVLLLKGLLTKEPKKRFSIADIRENPWFKGH
jgi:serine/threonine protein kinase